MPPTLFALVIFHTGSQVFLPRARLKLNPPTYASQGSRVTGCTTMPSLFVKMEAH
jgi:hypothetical protein